jgi:hypothetical protein
MFDDDVDAVVAVKNLHIWTAILAAKRFPGSL